MFFLSGLITRQDAETLLKNEQIGSFIVRVSEKIWGYAISLKEEERCKHYLVDSANGHYQFPGTNQIEHKTLGGCTNSIVYESTLKLACFR